VRLHPARLSPGRPETAEMGENRCLGCDRKRLSPAAEVITAASH
jgi:hypothetical protein